MAEIAVDVAKTNVVTTGKPHKVILRLALPTLAAMLSQSLVNEIDIVLFARLPEAEASNAQAALFPSLVLLWAFGGSLSAISVGTQAMTARRFAEDEHERAGAVLFNALVFTLLGGALFVGLGYAAQSALLSVLIKVPGARESADAYLDWRMLGILSMAVTAAFKAFFDGIGKTTVHFVSAIVMNVINIVCCLLLIFGNQTLGIPKMGIAGAGLAAVIATYIGLAIMVGYALLPAYRQRYRPFDLKKLSPSLLWALLKVSIPGAIATIAVMTGFALFAMIASELDKIDQVAGAAAAEPVNSAAVANIVAILKLTFTACLAFGTATATLVSQSLGEKEPSKAERFGWASVKLGLLIFGVVGMAEVVFSRQILGFMASSEAVRSAALTPLVIMGVCTPLIATAMILTQALFGAGATKFVMVVELILHFLCLVPLAWLFSVTLGLGQLGLWLAAVCYIVALAIAMVAKFKLGSWKQIKL
jgi:multidrug resistance protein, MATE family